MKVRGKSCRNLTDGFPRWNRPQPGRKQIQVVRLWIGPVSHRVRARADAAWDLLVTPGEEWLHNVVEPAANRFPPAPPPG